MGELALVLAACAGVPCVVFYFLLRHWIFAVLALWSPLVVFLIAALFRQHGPDQALVASLFGTMCALSLGDHVVRGVSAGLDPRTGSFSATRFVTLAVGPLLAAYLLSLGVDAVVLHEWRICAVFALLFAAGFAAAFAGNWLCAFFPFSEQFIARANAAREWRERMLEQFFPAMQPRWAFSVTGIAMVLGAVAAFGIRDAHVYWSARVAVCIPVSVVFIFAGLCAVARNWRVAMALALTTVFNGTLLFWALMRHDPYSDPFTTGAMLMVSSVPLGLIAVRLRLYLREGDDIAAALAVAIGDEGAIAAAMGVIAGVAGLLAVASFAMLSPALVFAVSSTFAALLLFPALAVALYTLVPRYRTVDDVFGRR
jgi:hypothetical protein